MKKNTLYVASALLSVMLVSGFAQAKSADVAATATGAATKTTQTAKPMMGMQGQGGPMSKLSEASRKLFQESMMKTREENKATFEQIMAKRTELQTIMKAPTFDKAAYLAKEDEIQALHNKMTKTRAESFASVAAQLSAEERAALAETHGGPMMGGMRQGMNGKGMKGKGMMRGDCKGPGDCPMMDDSHETQPSKTSK